MEILLEKTLSLILAITWVSLISKIGIVKSAPYSQNVL